MFGRVLPGRLLLGLLGSLLPGSVSFGNLFPGNATGGFVPGSTVGRFRLGSVEFGFAGLVEGKPGFVGRTEGLNPLPFPTFTPPAPKFGMAGRFWG